MSAPAAFTRSTVVAIKQGDLKMFTAGEAASTAVSVGRVRDIVISGKPIFDNKDIHGRRFVVGVNVTVKAILLDVDDALANRILDYCATPMGIRIDYNELTLSTFAPIAKYFSKDSCPVQIGDNFEVNLGGEKPGELPVQTEFTIHPSEWGALFTTAS